MSNACIAITDQRNDWLDICRALAVTMVVVSHGRFFLIGAWPHMEFLKAGGFLGVELFFCLSGLLIGQFLLATFEEKGTRGLVPFWKRRWLRTLPNYFLVLALNLILAAYMIRPAEINDWWRYVFFLQNFASPQPTFFPESWSLSIEEYFYLLLPIVTALMIKIIGISARSALWCAALTILIITTIARILVLAFGDPSWGMMRGAVVLRMDATIYGLIGGLAYFQSNFRLKRWMVAAGFAAFAFCYIYAAMSTPAGLDTSVFARSALFTLASLACSAILLTGLSWHIASFARNVASFIARISYSAYLLNLSVIASMNWLLSSTVSPTTWHEATLLFIVYLVTVVCCSWFVYRYFENPLMKLAHRSQK